MTSTYDTQVLTRPGYSNPNNNVASQIARGSSLLMNANGIQPTPAEQLNIVVPPTMMFYQPYTLGYTPGTTAIHLPGNTANPPPAADQYNHTSPHTYSQFTPTDLPPILFRLEHKQDTFIDPTTGEDIPVPALCDAATRRQIVTSRGDRLRYFSFLPRFIATDVPGAQLEFWFRLDYRLEMNDIRMRMERNPAGALPRNNTLNMRRVRFRNNIGADTWASSRSWPVQAEVYLLDNLTGMNICLNTTMKVDVANNRFLKPTFHADDTNCRGPPIGYFDTGLPMNYFLANKCSAIPSRRMFARICLKIRLQRLKMAITPGPAGRTPEAYHNLGRDDDPPWWHDNHRNAAARADQNGRVIYELDGQTHRTFMEMKAGDPALFFQVTARNRTAGIAR